MNVMKLKITRDIGPFKAGIYDYDFYDGLLYVDYIKDRALEILPDEIIKHDDLDGMYEDEIKKWKFPYAIKISRDLEDDMRDWISGDVEYFEMIDVDKSIDYHLTWVSIEEILDYDVPDQTLVLQDLVPVKDGVWNAIMIFPRMFLEVPYVAEFIHPTNRYEVSEKGVYFFEVINAQVQTTVEIYHLTK